MSKKCPKCDSGNVHITQYHNPHDNMATCYACGCAGMEEDFPEQTLFDRITASTEVLAEKLVYCVPVPLFDPGAGLERWYTVFSPFDAKKYFRTKEEAVTHAVAKLKEVADE